MATDYTRSELDVLIDLIRRDNQNKPLTTGQVTFGSPNLYTAEPGVDRNTLIVATSIAGRGYEGSQTFYYNRVPLNLMVGPDPNELVFVVSDDQTRIVDLLPAINERFNINLTPETIIDRPLPALGQHEDEAFVLQAAPLSLVYIDQVTLRIKPELVPLSYVLQNTRLNGLTYQPPVQTA